MNDLLATLDGLASAVWDLWEGASGDAEAPCGIAALATARKSGGGAARMVVLRAADRRVGTLEIWTNTASGKVDDIRADPEVELLFWLSGDQLQIRARGIVDMSQGSKSTWDELGSGSRLNYATSPAPGDKIDAPDAAAPEPDRAQFTILTLRVERIDVLSLAHRPHRRAIVDADGARWVAP